MHIIRLSTLLLCGCLLATLLPCKSDDSPGFFLKITKNVPRLGRRSLKDNEGFFKNIKAIPRIGRSDMNVSELNNVFSWLDSLPVPSKRVLLTPTISTERELSVVQPVNSNTLIQLLERDAISADSVKFVHWKDFDRALQQDTDLYNKVMILGRRPDQQLKQDLHYGTSMITLYDRVADENDNFMFPYHPILSQGAGNSVSDGLYNRPYLHYNHL